MIFARSQMHSIFDSHWLALAANSDQWHLRAAAAGARPSAATPSIPMPAAMPQKPHDARGSLRAFLRLKVQLERERRSPELRAARLAKEEMARKEYRNKNLAALRGGARAWNEWRAQNGHVRVDLQSENLADWSGLAGADFSGCNLTYADLRWNNLDGANFRGASLRYADLTESTFDKADFTGAILDHTVFGSTDLRKAVGLAKVEHRGPSIISTETLFLSRGTLPMRFMAGAGISRTLIDGLPSLIGGLEAMQFYTCFISHSSADDRFVARLYKRMQRARLRVWNDVYEMQGGKEIVTQLTRAIHRHDRLLLVLSPASMRSRWVKKELKAAIENGQTLFPIRLTTMERIEEWKCVDSASGVNLAAKVRNYYIPDFSGWTKKDKFEAGFKRLVQDLRKAAATRSRKPGRGAAGSQK